MPVLTSEHDLGKVLLFLFTTDTKLANSKALWALSFMPYSSKSGRPHASKVWALTRNFSTEHMGRVPFNSIISLVPCKGLLTTLPTAELRYPSKPVSQ
eukprot:2656296-Amphidinium_carterae.1